MKRFTMTAFCLILALLLALGCASTFFAETIYTNGDYNYTLLGNQNISIYSWDGTGELDLPEKLDVYKIKEIRNNCFFGREDLTQVALNRASYLTRIGVGAFKNSSVTGELNIPPQLTNVATGAFQNCDSLTVLYYNAMSKLISSQCFYDCDALSEVYLADGLQTIESFAFADCDSLGIVRIPDTVTSISDTAFADCPNIVIYCYTDSYAHGYAVDNGIDYVLIDAPTDPTEPTVPTEPTTVTEATVATEATTPTETEATVATETEPTTATSAPEGYILGDADGSGNVDIVDATFVQRVTINAEVPIEYDILMHGDVDGNGELEATDVTFLMRHIIRVKTPYAIGEIVY